MPLATRRGGIEASFNPLPIGAVFPTLITAAYDAREAKRFQSPTNRGSLSDARASHASSGATRRFNPLPIGAVFPTARPPLGDDRRVDSRFNPLPIGAVFPTEQATIPHWYALKASFNPLPIGAVFPT